eukprot:scaffold1771_cov343-Pavlova_lutheri.AAC.5
MGSGKEIDRSSEMAGKTARTRHQEKQSTVREEGGRCKSAKRNDPGRRAEGLTDGRDRNCTARNGRGVDRTTQSTAGTKEEHHAQKGTLEDLEARLRRSQGWIDQRNESGGQAQDHVRDRISVDRRLRHPQRVGTRADRRSVPGVRGVVDRSRDTLVHRTRKRHAFGDPLPFPAHAQGGAHR